MGSNREPTLIRNFRISKEKGLEKVMSKSLSIELETSLTNGAPTTKPELYWQKEGKYVAMVLKATKKVSKKSRVSYFHVEILHTTIQGTPSDAINFENVDV